ncbi:magnesium/cobalt transporter CorA [Arundinibacter roseus]|uniref:Magnesium transport protein CorA n=1 Tax=Arundinibacter roseus TaxID=2070510 RepID=A0A4R4KLU8_9BACT|nr:magnesium/cobalt transporter CorA [Arundinibacter roseus]TDB67932.1 magnesium/cobalt transporter CorA [Arundinibacter roseus]
MPKNDHRKQRKTLLTSPGTLTYVGEQTNFKTLIKRIEYNESFYQEEVASTLEACTIHKVEGAQPHVTWLNVTGIHESNVIESLGRLYHLHPLLLEDVMNTLQKPKIETYEDGHLYVTLKMIHGHEDAQKSAWGEHISLILGRDYLISFQEEHSGDIFLPVIERLKASVGKTRRHGADYLLYALMDVIVDHYFITLERLGDQLEDMEDTVIGNKISGSLEALYTLKREVTFIRKYIWPLREMVSTLIRPDAPLVSKRVFPYFRDILDHTIQLVDNLDTYRELVASLVEVQLSAVSNRMNSVMKTLTIFSAIFMPLTFIVGVYGMNFRYMPELENPNGYYATWGIMVLITFGMIVYFRWKKWL